MIRKPLFLVPVVLGTCFALLQPLSSSMPAGPGVLIGLSEASSTLADQALGAMVFLRVDQPANKGNQSGAGTGFVIDAMRGYVVTNNHVVGDMKSKLRVVMHDGRFTWGDPVGVDPKTDLAVVRIPEGFARRQVKWGNSDAMRNGHWVMAVGNPLGLTGTSTLGVVSGLHRVLELTEGSFEDFIQHDAFIDHGSSGGPLLNMQAEVIGVNTAIGSTAGGIDAWQGISYAVPSVIAQTVVEDLIAYGEVRRAYFGVRVEDINAATAGSKNLPKARGAIISKVGSGSPAEMGGVKKNDAILAVDEVEIFGAGHLRARIAASRPGQIIELLVWRNKRQIKLTVTAGEKK